MLRHACDVGFGLGAGNNSTNSQTFHRCPESRRAPDCETRPSRNARDSLDIAPDESIVTPNPGSCILAAIVLKR